MQREGPVTATKGRPKAEQRTGPRSGDELQHLRRGLRDRHSIDHLARAWTSTLIALLLAGVWIKLCRDSAGWPLYLWPVALLCLAVLANAANEARLGFRMLRDERARLQRVRELEMGSPAPRELF